MTDARHVILFIFDDMEVLDFAGPFEVFNVTGELNDPAHFKVETVALTADLIKARGQLKIVPDYTLDNCPTPDILIVPGGWGTRPLLPNERLIDWLSQMAEQVELLLSVCTGSLLLAKAGVVAQWT